LGTLHVPGQYRSGRGELLRVVLDDKPHQNVGIEGCNYAQGRISSMDTCLPFGGVSMPAKSKTDFFFHAHEQPPIGKGVPNQPCARHSANALPNISGNRGLSIGCDG